MANGAEITLGFRLIYQYTRYWETWKTCFPRYLGMPPTPTKGWDYKIEDEARPYETLVKVYFHDVDRKYHWFAAGVLGLAMEEGLYRAEDAANPYTPLQFPFPNHAIDRTAAGPAVPLAAPPEAGVPSEEYTICYIKVRAGTPAPEDRVCFSIVHPELLAKSEEYYCTYGTEAGGVKYVLYTLNCNPTQFAAAAFVTSISVPPFDCGPLPAAYNGKRNPNVRWLMYNYATQGLLSRNANIPTVFTIDLTSVPDP